MSYWKPGQSGNPHGRPMKGAALSDSLRKLLEMSLEEFKSYKPQTVKEQIALNTIQMALEKEIFGLRETYDRTEGRPAQTTIISQDEEEPFRIHHIYDKDKENGKKD